MMSALLGKKIGMTNVFSSEGKLVPVTVVQVGPCVVTQIKTNETDGYNALQLGFDEKPVEKLNKPIAGHLKKTGDKGFRVLREFRTDDAESVKPGATIGIDIFAIGDKVNISGISKGRGFQGTIKRHGFSRGPETHGSRNHRKPGSIGNSAWPGKVFKGKKLPGHMGTNRETVKNLTIVDIKHEDNLLLVKGPLPGFKTGILEVQKTDKK
ncbi:MAG: 50S ribosomal protein L3 [Desulfobacula sp.]|uniref:50S ribosomal protein L3 n=1 Tax=Desulfobacula sp. TaxID=2593537 RepID=UPI001D2256BD|nr:50S ribosomal protein L3 [Desulfobacula sp.]MBT3804718.1 50S ribosomal protein L3 [Desulfobacula sp.]MBT4024068.1 50S ribosomal protein L3 [Desulfobacula sp.]MBT4198430.1 50S ribosomal protein L3 [Desulfobacula sp.]MBT4506168.1 50S ribosomal protein L3 [Desulfobacula sp.]